MSTFPVFTTHSARISTAIRRKAQTVARVDATRGADELQVCSLTGRLAADWKTAVAVGVEARGGGCGRRVGGRS